MIEISFSDENDKRVQKTKDNKANKFLKKFGLHYFSRMLPRTKNLSVLFASVVGGIVGGAGMFFG